MAITITSVSPKNLPTEGGRTIRVVGTDMNTVTSVSFGGTVVESFTKVSPTILEFATPPLPTLGSQNKVISLNNGGTAVNASFTFVSYDVGKTPASTKYVQAWHKGTVYTGAQGNKAPWVQQKQIMAIKYPDGKDVEQPISVQAPLFDDTTASGDNNGTPFGFGI